MEFLDVHYDCCMEDRDGGMERKVAWRDDVSCSHIKTGQRLVRFMLASSLPPSLGQMSQHLVNTLGLIPNHPRWK